MESTKIVVRFSDGRIKKGYTSDFNSNNPIFHILRAHGQSLEPEGVNLADLKAIFFVKTFAGNPNYTERKQFTERDNPKGVKAEIAFADGEILQGRIPAYDTNKSGFFFFPVDPKSNNLYLFAVRAAVRSCRYLRLFSTMNPRENHYQCLIPAEDRTLLMLSEEEIRLLKLVLPKIMETDSAREYIVGRLGSAYIQIGQRLLQEMESISTTIDEG